MFTYQEKKRERRRRDLQRMKDKALRYAKTNGWGNSERYRRAAEYLAVCSCDMCGNPRRHFGHRTLQELRMNDVQDADDGNQI